MTASVSPEVIEKTIYDFDRSWSEPVVIEPIPRYMTSQEKHDWLYDNFNQPTQG